MLFSFNENFLNKKIKCRVNSKTVSYEIILPISDFQNYDDRIGLISFPVNNLEFIFEDFNMNKSPFIGQEYRNLDVNNNSNPDLFSQLFGNTNIFGTNK